MQTYTTAFFDASFIPKAGKNQKEFWLNLCNFMSWALWSHVNTVKLHFQIQNTEGYLFCGYKFMETCTSHVSPANGKKGLCTLYIHTIYV